jgi:uncharacterized membrane protein
MPSTPPRTSLRLLRHAVASLAGILAAALTAMEARADLKLCNTTSSRIGVAIGYQDTNGWTTEGWWNVAPQTCETLYKGALSSRFYYIHAITRPRREWAGSRSWPTDKSSRSGVQDRGRRGHKAPAFEVDTQESKDWTIRLTDPSERGR